MAVLLELQIGTPIEAEPAIFASFLHKLYGLSKGEQNMGPKGNAQ